MAFRLSGFEDNRTQTLSSLPSFSPRLQLLSKEMETKAVRPMLTPYRRMDFIGVSLTEFNNSSKYNF